MSTPTTRRRVAAVALTLTAVVGVTVGATNALFTDQATITNNTFTTGSVHISTTPTTSALSVSGMMPGDVLTAPITVSNTGTGQLRYAILSTSSEATLAGQLSVAVKTGITAGNCTTANFSGTGTAVTLQATALGTTTGEKLIGDSAQGAQTGDRVLAGSASEVLCFQVTLPLSSGNTYEGLTDTDTLTFNAEQTSNN